MKASVNTSQETGTSTPTPSTESGDQRRREAEVREAAEAEVTDDPSKIEKRTPTVPTPSLTDLNIETIETATSDREAGAREVDEVASEEATTPGPQLVPQPDTTMPMRNRKNVQREGGGRTARAGRYLGWTPCKRRGRQGQYSTRCTWCCSIVRGTPCP